MHFDAQRASPCIEGENAGLVLQLVTSAYKFCIKAYACSCV